MTPLLALLLAAPPQAAPRPTPPPVPQQFSILIDPCARTTRDRGNEVVVCGSSTAATPRLPLPDDRGPPDHPVPSNPDVSGLGALAASGSPCATLQGGCQVGIGGPLVAAAISGLATAVSDGIKDRKDRAARRRDAGRRVPIPMDDAPAN